MSDLRAKSDAALNYARKDLKATIDLQERGERLFPGMFPKLGQYWDDLSDVLAELRRRQAKGAL
jgi:hypothetical protein